ncbi:MAG TPA: serine/threonine-protein kinase, partial [Polyangiaceae bacterium]
MSASSQGDTKEPGVSLVGQSVLGRYRIMHPLARGGMGVVYLGRVEGSAGFTKPVVVKTVIPALGSGEEGAALFAREARIVSHLQHPGIVAVVDFGRVGRSYVMVLEYVHGYHVGQWSRFVNETRGPLPVGHAVHVVLEVLEALHYAHRLTRADGVPLGIVHRDISPPNILIDAQGHVKLSDFGIARMADDDYKTEDGQFRGTLPFSAPEAFEGTPPTPHNDQYACAVLLYQLLAGSNPFRGGATNVTITRVLTHVPPLLSEVREDVPPALAAAVARAIAKYPQERFPDIAEFSAALRATRKSGDEDARAFSAQIAQDFAGATLPAHLGIESLAERDAAWREAQDGGPALALSSSPPSSPPDAVTTVSVGPARAPLEKPVERSAKDERPGERRLLLGGFVFLALCVAGLGAAVLFGRPGTDSDAPAKVLVIEKQQVDDGVEGAVAPASAAPETAPEVPSAAVSEPVASAKVRAPGAASSGEKTP